MQSLQVKIIAFERPDALIKQLQRLFPDAEVRHHLAIDVRSVALESLAQADVVSHATTQSLRYGRRWDHELGSKGGVGLAQAVRIGLLDDTARPLLMFEEDCVIGNEKKLQEQVAALVAHQSKFDVAAFGVFHRSQPEVEAVEFLDAKKKDWTHITDVFWGLHCVLYTPSGRAKVAAALAEPLDMQIDSLYGNMARNGRLHVIAQVHDSVVAQSWHMSEVQTPLQVQRSRMAVLITVAVALLAAIMASAATAFVCARVWRRR